MKKLFKFVLFIALIAAIISYIPRIIEWYFPYNYNLFVEKYSKEYDVDKALLFAVIKAESNFNKNAESSKGAKGLMQIMDDTAEWCASKAGIDEYDLFDPEDNIKIGAFYLSYLLEKCGNEKNAVAAYNAGHGNVDKWLSDENFSKDGENLHDIPFAETRKYVNKVMFYKKFYNWRLGRQTFTGLFADVIPTSYFGN